MSEAKFTKGPWTIEHDREFDECIIYAEREEDRVVICEVDIYVTVSDKDHSIDLKQIKANANLIAAAPEMYEVLEDFCKGCLGKLETNCTCRVCKIGKALRKARGGE